MSATIHIRIDGDDIYIDTDPSIRNEPAKAPEIKKGLELRFDYIAMDGDGIWYGYTSKPKFTGDDGFAYWRVTTREAPVPLSVVSLLPSKDEINWKDSLMEYPIIVEGKPYD